MNTFYYTVNRRELVCQEISLRFQPPPYNCRSPIHCSDITVVLEGEKTLKLLFSVHVQGGVAFQQSSDSPHIAQECDHGLETRVCCCEEAPHDSLDTEIRGFTPFSTEENKGECNDRLDPSQIREGDGGPSLSCEAATALLHNGNSEDKRACACENSDFRVQEESSTAGVVRSGDIGDSSDGLQSDSEVIACRTSSCGQQKEEAGDLICESQEKGHNSVDEKALEEKELSERSPAAEAGDMGITQSLDTPESSDAESYSQSAETDDEEEDVHGDLIEPEGVREESKKSLEVNPDGDAPLDCSKHENEMHVCRDVHDYTGDPGIQKLEGSEGGVCEKIRCNVEGNQDHLDSLRTSDHEDANEEFQESLEMPYVETDGNQQDEELSRTSAAEHESISCLHEINQELLLVENPILSIEDAVEEGCEVDGQRQSSSDILQTEPGPELGSPTAASEDTLEPEDLEVLLGSGCEGIENVQQNQENKLICEAQATLEEVLESAIPADMEKVNLPDSQDMTSNNEIMWGTSEMEFSEGNSDIDFLNANQSGYQGDPSDMPVLVESNESGISEESLAVNAEDLMSVLVHNEHVDGALNVSKALDKDDIIDSSVCPEQAQKSFDPMSQDAESVVQEVRQPVGGEDLLKGELNNIFDVLYFLENVVKNGLK